MARLQVDLGVSIPSIGDRPPLVHAGTRLKVTVVHVLLGGAIAAGIIWIERGMPLPRRSDRPVEDETAEVVPARFGRAP